MEAIVYEYSSPAVILKKSLWIEKYQSMNI